MAGEIPVTRGLAMDGDDIDDFLRQIEKTFQVDLLQHPQALSTMVTVGDLEALLMRLVKVDESASCAHQRAFFRLRNLLPDISGSSVPITPKTELRTLFPLSRRHRQWREFKKLAMTKGILLEGLQPPEWSMLVGLAGFFIGLLTVGFKHEVGLLLIGGAIGWWWLFATVAWLLPAATFEDLTRAVVRLNYRSLKPGQASRREVRSVVRDMLAVCACEPASSIQPDTRFV